MPVLTITMNIAYLKAEMIRLDLKTQSKHILNMPLLQATLTPKLYLKKMKIKESKMAFIKILIQKKAGMAELMADKVEFKAKKISRNKNDIIYTHGLIFFLSLSFSISSQQQSMSIISKKHSNVSISCLYLPV